LKVAQFSLHQHFYIQISTNAVLHLFLNELKIEAISVTSTIIRTNQSAEF
jgi:hypothetical protein